MDGRYLIQFDTQTGQSVAGLDALTAALQRTDGAAVQAKASVAGVGQAGGDAAKQQISDLAAMAVGYQLLKQAVEAVGSAINEARETQRQFAKETGELRDELREVANLQGKGAPDDATVAGQLKLRLQTGQTRSEARKYVEQFEGTLPAAIDKGNITGNSEKGLASEIGLVGAKFGVRTGLDAGTAGDLAASIPGFEKITSVPQFAGRLGAIQTALNAGRGNLTPLVKTLLSTAGGIVDEDGGSIGSLPELAAVVGAASARSSSPATAGTRVRQAVRGLAGFTKDQGGKLAELGIVKGQPFLDSLERIAPFVEKEGVAGLAEAGFGNSTERLAIKQLVDELPVIRKRVDAARETAKTGGAGVLKANREFLDDKAGQRRLGLAARDAGEAVQGLQGEDLEAARTAAEGRLQGRGDLDSTGRLIQDTIYDGFGLAQKLGLAPNRQRRIDQEVRSDIQARNGRANIGNSFETEAKGFFRPLMTPDEFGRADERIRDSGGPAAGNGELIRKMDQLIQATQENKPREFGPVRDGWDGGPRPK